MSEAKRRNGGRGLLQSLPLNSDELIFITLHIFTAGLLIVLYASECDEKMCCFTLDHSRNIEKNIF